MHPCGGNSAFAPKQQEQRLPAIVVATHRTWENMMASKAKDPQDIAASTPATAPKKPGTRARTVRPASRRKASSSKPNGVAALVGVAAAGIAAGFALNMGRKVIVQAPSVNAGDWLEAIKLEHKAALALFDALLATDDGQPAKRTLLLTQLKHALAKHAFMEENTVYPALRAWGDTADADKLNHDHGYVKQALYDLENMAADAPEFSWKVSAFRGEVEAHIREEEDAIFPPLHKALSDADNAKLTAQANKEGFKMA
jgi:hemerythrin superfamily protein